MKLAMIGITTLVALSGIGQAAAADGKAVYDKACAVCHGGMGKVPKLGDKAAWAPFLKKGQKEMVAVVMKGLPAKDGMPPMPPKGGAANEADVTAAVGTHNQHSEITRSGISGVGV